MRITCVAGPCPFSKIESDQFSRGGQEDQCVRFELVRHRYLPAGGRSDSYHGQRCGPLCVPGDFRRFNELHASGNCAGSEYRSCGERGCHCVPSWANSPSLVGRLQFSVSSDRQSSTAATSSRAINFSAAVFSGTGRVTPRQPEHCARIANRRWRRSGRAARGNGASQSCFEGRNQ